MTNDNGATILQQQQSLWDAQEPMETLNTKALRNSLFCGFC